MTTLGGVPLSLEELGERARATTDREVWDFVSGGSGAELTLRDNRAAFDRLRLIPRVFSDVSATDCGTTLAGTPAGLPVAVAPMAYQRLLHPDGELAAARAAAAHRVPFTIGTLSSCPIEEITAIGGDCWFQLYWLRDRGLLTELVRRAEDSGCRALMVTADVPRMGRRLRDVRNGFALPGHIVAANLSAGTRHGAQDRHADRSAVADHTEALFDPSVSWDDLAALREQTRLPLIVKGILDPDDADRAASIGADAIVVSNHGGRQLDGVAASVDALPAVRDAVADRCPLLLDSGVRTGTDVLKSLALGAQGVLLGRPVLWGLAVAGEDGVHTALTLLEEELRDALTLSGCPDLPSTRRLRVVEHPGKDR